MEREFEKVLMQDETFRIKCFVSSTMEQVIAAHPHWHPEIEILYVTGGYARQQVGDNIFNVNAGDMVVINRDQLHSTYSFQGCNCEILVIMFDASCFSDCLGVFEKNTTGSIFDSTIVFNNPITARPDTHNQLAALAENIKTEANTQSPGYKYIIKARLYMLAGLLSRDALYAKKNGTGRQAELIREILKNTFDLIDRSFTEEISIKMAAGISHLSIPHFCRLFKKATGMTFNDYLSFYRVNKSEEMLRAGSSVTQAAADSGFGCISTFIRNFKKYTQYTPSEYKKIFENNNIVH